MYEKIRFTSLIFLIIAISNKSYASLNTLNANFTDCFGNYYCGNEPVEVFVDSKASYDTKKKSFFEAVKIKCSESSNENFEIKYIETSVPTVFRFEISSSQYKEKIDSMIDCRFSRSFDQIMSEVHEMRPGRLVLLPKVALNEDARLQDECAGEGSREVNGKCIRLCKSDEIYIRYPIDQALEFSTRYLDRKKEDEQMQIQVWDKLTGKLSYLNQETFNHLYEPRCTKCDDPRRGGDPSKKYVKLDRNICVGLDGCADGYEAAYPDERDPLLYRKKCRLKCKVGGIRDYETGICKYDKKQCESILSDYLKQLDNWYMNNVKKLKFGNCSQQQVTSAAGSLYNYFKEEIMYNLKVCGSSSTKPDDDDFFPNKEWARHRNIDSFLDDECMYGYSEEILTKHPYFPF